VLRMRQSTSRIRISTRFRRPLNRISERIGRLRETYPRQCQTFIACFAIPLAVITTDMGPMQMRAALAREVALRVSALLPPDDPRRTNGIVLACSRDGLPTRINGGERREAGDHGAMGGHIRYYFKAFTKRGQNRGIADYTIDSGAASLPIIGRLVATKTARRTDRRSLWDRSRLGGTAVRVRPGSTTWVERERMPLEQTQPPHEPDRRVHRNSTGRQQADREQLLQITLNDFDQLLSCDCTRLIRFS
jgi:hypothetical protein